MNNTFLDQRASTNNHKARSPGPLVYVPTRKPPRIQLLAAATQVATEFGHSSGAVQHVIKGGTNETHGSVYEYFRTETLNAVRRRLSEIRTSVHPPL